jgi:hypothetical protein
MDTKKFLIGTLVGGIAFFLLGYLVYGFALTNFFSGHSGTATGVSKSMEEIGWGWLILGNLASGALLSYIFLKWANIATFAGGASAGAVIGFLMALSFDMVSFGTTNIMDLTGSLADVVAASLMTAIAGGIIGAVLGMGSK